MFLIVMIPYLREWIRTPTFRSWLIAAVIGTPLMISLFPLVLDWGEHVRARKAEARARWREAYRKSPEPNLLNLHD